MNRLELNYGFQFQDHLVFHNNISEIITDKLTFVLNPDWNLAFSSQAPLAKFDQQSIFIYLFEKA